jgi:Na+-driven multidrug efflux pump
MFTLLGISGMAWAAIVIAALILIVAAFGVIKKRYPEKPRKPLKRI